MRVEASGICHTDIHAAHGDWPVKPTLPFIPGHEGVGIVAAVGDRGHVHREGDRVAVPWLGYACGRAALQRGAGDLVRASAADGLLEGRRRTPSTCSATPARREDPRGRVVLDAAPLTCAGVTTYKAVKVSGARPASLVAVVGVGGLGHLGVQYARIAGATVVAVDVSEEKLKLAQELGAVHLVTPASRTRPRRSRSWAGRTP